MTDCYYAAGIVLARWYFGYPADAVEVSSSTSSDQGAQNGSIRCGNEILIVGQKIAPKEMPDFSKLQGGELQWARQCLRVVNETELLVLATGFRAPVRQRGQSGISPWRKNRTSDFERARTLATWVADDPVWTVDFALPEIHLEIACVRARALLSARRSSVTLYWLARDLHKLGRLEREQIHEICTDDLGGAGPARATWSASWPPSFEQLQSGYIPYIDIFEEDLIERTYEAYPWSLIVKGK